MGRKESSQTVFPFNVGGNNYDSNLPVSKVLLYFQVAQSYISDKQLTEDVLIQPLFALCGKSRLSAGSYQLGNRFPIKGFQG